MIKLSVNNINKSFDGKQVLKGLSFQANDGDLVSLLGPSGCGKSTMLRIICGLENPDSGSVLVDGKDITRTKPERRNIGMVFQNYALFPSMNVAKNVGYGLKMKKVNKQEIDERVSAALKLVHLSGYEKRSITKLSGGEQQRVALARALVVKPDILLLDEPLSALDRKIRAEMQYEIRNIQQEVGITTIFVTHDQEEALTMSDKVILMNRGNIEQEGIPSVIYSYPVSEFASDFLGKANLLSCQLETAGDGKRFAVGNGWRLKTETDVTDGPINVAVRGEQFKIHSEATDETIPFTIEKKIFLGSICKLFGKIGSDSIEVSALSPDTESYQIGQIVYLSTKPQSLICYEKERE